MIEGVHRKYQYRYQKQYSVCKCLRFRVGELLYCTVLYCTGMIRLGLLIMSSTPVTCSLSLSLSLPPSSSLSPIGTVPAPGYRDVNPTPRNHRSGGAGGRLLSLHFALLPAILLAALGPLLPSHALIVLLHVVLHVVLHLLLLVLLVLPRLLMVLVVVLLLVVVLPSLLLLAALLRRHRQPIHANIVHVPLSVGECGVRGPRRRSIAILPDIHERKWHLLKVLVLHCLHRCDALARVIVKEALEEIESCCSLGIL